MFLRHNFLIPSTVIYGRWYIRRLCTWNSRCLAQSSHFGYVNEIISHQMLKTNFLFFLSGPKHNNCTNGLVFWLWTGSIPSLMILPLLFFIPESPRWLVRIQLFLHLCLCLHVRLLVLLPKENIKLLFLSNVLYYTEQNNLEICPVV